MTRPQTHAYGVVTPSTRQPLLEAMLRAFAWLVSNVVSMLATIFNRHTRDWHTDAAHEDQLPTSNDSYSATCHRFETIAAPRRSLGMRPVVAVTREQASHRQSSTKARSSLEACRSAHAIRLEGRGIQAHASSPRASRAHPPLVIPEAAQRLSGTHSSAIGICKMVPGSRCAWPG